MLYPGIHVATQGLHLLIKHKLESVGVEDPSKINSTLSPLLVTTEFACGIHCKKKQKKKQYGRYHFKKAVGQGSPILRCN